jgi:hypothetical protein
MQLRNTYVQQLDQWISGSVANPGCLSRTQGPGSKKIPDPHQRISVFLTLNTVSKLSEKWYGKFIPDPGSIFFFYPGSGTQGSKKHRIPDPDPQNWLRGFSPEMGDHRNSTVNQSFQNLPQIDLILVGIGRPHLHIFTTRCSINSHSRNWIKFHLNKIRKWGEAGPGLFAGRTECLNTWIILAFASIKKSEENQKFWNSNEEQGKLDRTIRV